MSALIDEIAQEFIAKWPMEPGDTVRILCPIGDLIAALQRVASQSADEIAKLKSDIDLVVGH